MKLIKIIIVISLFLNFGILSASPITVGLIKHEAGSTDNGYIMFAPMNDTTTYLIDKCGYLVHKWGGKYLPGLSVYLLPNGKLLKTAVDTASPFGKTGGSGGIISIISWDGNVEWEYNLSTISECQHHDVKYMPNGNILVIAWDKKTSEEVKIAGKNPGAILKELWSEEIKELRPIGKDSAEVVWEWKVWDHLVQDFDSTKENYGKVELHPELLDLNYGAGPLSIDWLHMNSIDYNPEFDQILVSLCNINEIWIIDHNTTTSEAASHQGGKYGKGGDLLYRWGNPSVYKHGTPNNQKLFAQHDAYWIVKDFPFARGIMLFNNFNGNPENNYSTVDIIQPPSDSKGFYNPELPYLPDITEWSYKAPKPSDFYSRNLSSAQMLKNSNVLICSGANGHFFEIDSLKNTVWEYINPVTMNGILSQGNVSSMTNNLFRCIFYYADYLGFEGKDLSRKGIIENVNPNSDDCSLGSSIRGNALENIPQLYPNPTDNLINIDSENDEYSVKVYDMQGRLVISGSNINYINTSDLANGIYMLNISYNNGNYSSKQFIVNR
ncbi:MAG: aryl-sulfate sulfotransferase [bacterium]